jgi:membrane-associated protease RseP (regulator of RpoE activity)
MPPVTLGAWLQQNGPFVVLLVGAVVFVAVRFGLDVLLSVALTVIGLSFVIFIHELGHFVAAKWCDVHVQTFSLGFGPALPGCSYQYGETVYKIGMLPLGGYVAMVGEGPEADEDENYPRSFKNKSVGQRMLIISAGVIMNVLFGFLCFVGVYRFNGLERPPAIVSQTEPGSPAWGKGVHAGWMITAIDDKKTHWFEDMKLAVSLSREGRQIHFEFQDRDGKAIGPIAIEPRKSENDWMPVIGVAQARELELAPRRWQKQVEFPYKQDSPAAFARALPLQPGDRVVALSDGQSEEVKVTRKDGQTDWAALCQRFMDPQLRGKTLRLKVRRADQQKEEELEVGPLGFDFGDRIVGTTDPDHPDDPFRLKPLRPDPTRGEDSSGFKDPFDFRERMARLAGKPAVIQVRREKASAEELVSLLVPPAFQMTFGLQMTPGKIAAVRENSPAAGVGVVPGDRIEEVSVLSDKDEFLTSVADLWLTGARHPSVTPWSLALHCAHLSKVEPERQEERLQGQELDPVRLPWALTERIARKPFPSRCQVRLGVRGTVNHDAQGVKLLKPMPWDPSWSLEAEAPLSMSAPMSIPQLGIAYWVESTVAAVIDGSPADKAGLKPGDQLTQIRIQSEGKKGGKPTWGDWFEMKSVRGKDKDVYDQWAHFHWAIQQGDGNTIELKVKRSGSANEIPIGPLTAEPDLTWPRVERGVLLLPDTRRQQAANTLEAISFGIDRTVGFIQQIYLSLSRLATNRLSYKNLGGPIRIAEQTFNAADADFAAFILLLGLISVNLAVVNFLPIPVLDGGHMVFLIYEKLRGKPPPEIIRAAATYAGLATILALMVFVFWIDISHFWGAIRRSVSP